MVLFLQANYNGTFAIAEWCDSMNCYFELEGNISKDTPIATINELVVKKYKCSKLVIDF